MSQYFIKLTAYSGIRVFEMHIHGTPVMRRLRDSYINATQILRAAGLAKPQRTKILEKDVTRGIHEKVQGGYAGFQGTWIPADSAQALGAEYGLEEEIAFLVAQPVDQAVIDAMPQSAPPTPRKTATRAAAATPTRKWSESSESEPDQAEDSHSPEQVAQGPTSEVRAGRRGPGRPRTRTARFTPIDPASRPRKPKNPAELSPTSRKSGRVSRTASAFVAPGPQPNTAYAAPIAQRVDMQEVIVTPRKKLHCVVCSTSVTPQWRKGPRNQPLCNKCGVKYKIQRYTLENGHPPVTMEDITDTSDSAGYNDPVDVLYPLKAQARALRREYKETQQDTEQMSRILIQSLLHDRDIDQEYRQTVVKTQSNKRTYEASFYDSGLIEEDVLDEEDIIKRFIHAVKKKRHISRPHQVNTRRSAAAVR